MRSRAIGQIAIFLGSSAVAASQLGPACSDLMEVILNNLKRPGVLQETTQNQLVINRLSKELAPIPFDLNPIIDTSGYMGPMSGESDVSLAFIRDYYPLQISEANAQGEVHAVLVNYPTYRNLSLQGTPYMGAMVADSNIRPPAGFSPNAGYFVKRAPMFSPIERKWIETKTLPLLFEGGDKAATADHFIIGEKVIQQNALSIDEIRSSQTLKNSTASPDSKSAFINSLVNSGYKKRNAQEVAEVFGKELHVDPSKVVVMPWMPGEKTGHVDIYIGELGGNAVAVPYVMPEAIQNLSDGERNFSNATNNWLNQQVERLQGQGIDVVRVPMLPPVDLRPSSLSPLGADANILSTVNWIVSGNKIYVPDYAKQLAKLSPENQTKFKTLVVDALAKRGYGTEWLNADKMVGTSGGPHCISANLLLPQ